MILKVSVQLQLLMLAFLLLGESSLTQSSNVEIHPLLVVILQDVPGETFWTFLQVDFQELPEYQDLVAE